jgi:hypothetical protein
MVFPANGQQARRLANSRENPQTDETRALGFPASQPICVLSSIVAAVRIRLRILSMVAEGLAWELAQNSFLSTSGGRAGVAYVIFEIRLFSNSSSRVSD